MHKEVFDKKRNEENSFPTCPKELWGKKEDRKKKKEHMLRSHLVSPLNLTQKLMGV